MNVFFSVNDDGITLRARAEGEGGMVGDFFETIKPGDGDVFGPVVNLAARAVKLAAAGEVVTPRAVAEAAGVRAESLGAQSLKGFDAAVELCRLVDADADRGVRRAPR